jgi:hypothetical protein
MGIGISVNQTAEWLLAFAHTALADFPINASCGPRAAYERRPVSFSSVLPHRCCRSLPIDERFVEYWYHDPWNTDFDGDGRTLADGSSFLLPYSIGLYHGFLKED